MNEAVVFIVHHSRELDDDACETKLIGVYTTEERALHAIDQLREKPGFRDYPADFAVDRYKLDMTHWQDGFALSSDDSL